MIRAAALLVLVAGCSLQWKNMRPNADESLAAQQAACAKLDSQQMGWNVAAIVAGGLSGASGLTTIALPSNQDVVYAMGAVSVVVTIASAVSTYVAAHYTQLFCRQCANIVPPTGTPP